MAGIEVLRRWQAALEVTRGTDLACTRKFGATGSIEKKIPGFTPDLDINSFDRMRTRDALLIEAGGTIECPATYEDFAWWLQLAVRGSVAGVLVSGTAYRYTFTPSVATDDLKSATFEWGDDFQAWESTFAMVESLTVKATPGSPMSMSANVIAKDRLVTTFTAALTDRAVETVLGKTGALTIDEPGGSIGTTAVTGRLLGFEHTIRNNLNRLYTMDNADGGAIKDLVRKGREFETKVLYRFDNITEYDRWRLNTQRLMKVKFVGSDASASVPREVSFYIPGKYEDAVIGQQDGQVTVEMTMRQLYDGTLAYASKYEVVNALVTLP